MLKERFPNLPDDCYRVINKTFDKALTNFLDSIDQQGMHLPPAFVMIDPFGFYGLPMRLIARLLKNPKSEVYVSFMYKNMDRFLTDSSLERPLDELFGCEDWRQGRDLRNGKDRKAFLYNLYKGQLKKNGAEQVVWFDLYEGERLEYAIFFGTKNLKGCDKMKEAIWRVAPLGGSRFRGSELRQLTFGSDVTDFSPLEEALGEQFRGEEWQSIEDVEEFIKSDATDFHSGQLRTALNAMEDDAKVLVDRPSGKGRASNSQKTQQLGFSLGAALPSKGRRTYPAGTRILFR